MNNKAVTFESLHNFGGIYTISLSLVLRRREGYNKEGQRVPERDASVDVTVGGQPLDCGVGWDLLALVASGNVQGAYYLGNCSCGEPGCSRILHPIVVRHEGEFVTWKVPVPYVKGDGSNSILVSFNAAQYRAQTLSLLADFGRAATDGGPLVRTNCYPGNLPSFLLEEAEKGWPGYGGCEPLTV